MIRFLIRFALFLLPIACVLSIAIWIAWDLGYAIPRDMVVVRQADNERILYRPMSRTQVFDYKLSAINYHQPNILLLGTSRMAHFMDDVVAKSDSFYNGYIDGMSIREAQWFIDRINPNTFPDIVILSIELTSFNQDNCDSNVYNLDIEVSLVEQVIEGTRRLWQNILLDKLALSTIYAQRNNNETPYQYLGEYALRYLLFTPTDDNAMRPSRGFDRYGARPYIHVDEQAHQQLRDRAYSQLENREFIYSQGTNPIPCLRTMLDLREVIQATQKHETTLIILALPYSPPMYDAFMTADDLSYFRPVRQAISDLLMTYGVSFYDFSDPATFEATTQFFSDGHHPSPLLSAKVFYEIAQNESILFTDFVSLDELLQNIQNTPHPYLFSDTAQLE